MNDKKDNKNFELTMEYMARGVMVGGSVGAIAGWFFMDFQRALGLGMLVGCLAGLTMKSFREDKDKK